MAFKLAPLPYAQNALAPTISERTMSFHYGKHHQTYVDKLNELIEGTEHQGQTLEEIICSADGPLFNNAAQVWNHTFFWSSMSPDGGGSPDGELAKAIESSFGSFDAMSEEFAETAKTHFGSGWTWLVKGADGLSVKSTSDADLPMRHGETALLTLDVWEHAYYLDHQNDRPAFVAAFLERLANWDFAAKNFADA
ncbi:MAG: superoxide dismutase [Ilumatobacteraceae bacterium]|nr:MAG: superoxide dismutase [Actinomycetota bacterium]